MLYLVHFHFRIKALISIIKRQANHDFHVGKKLQMYL